MLWKAQIAVFGNFSITTVRLGGESEKKEKPTQKQLALQAPPAQRPALWCGARRLGWSEECGESSEACAPRPARPGLPLFTRRRARRSDWGARRTPGAPGTAALPGLHSSRVDPAPPAPPAPSLPRPRVCSRGHRSGRSRQSSPVRLQQSSARRAAAPALSIPAAAPAALAARSTVWDARGRALRFVAYSWGRGYGWGLDGWCARPGSAATDTRCGRPTPLVSHSPACAPASKTERRGWVLLWTLRLRPFPDPCPAALVWSPGFYDSFPSVSTKKKPGSVFARTAQISLVLG